MHYINILNYIFNIINHNIASHSLLYTLINMFHVNTTVFQNTAMF
ncbi:hypothetical protein HMPREF1870_01050 [Bacteroidales bacterium KA00344]|nr:hypothetical protein HMPREF1870_01050 [Bacteroidales bacterium KA00344]